MGHVLVLLLCCLLAVTGCARERNELLETTIARYEAAAAAQRGYDSALCATGTVPSGRLVSIRAVRSRTDAIDEDPVWPAVLAAKADQTPEEAPVPGASKKNYVNWRKRRGQAYPGDFWRSWGRWGLEMPETLWDDTKAVATNKLSLVAFGLAAASGAAIAGSDLDDRVEGHYSKHGSQLSKSLDGIGGFAGNPAFHYPLAGAMVVGTLALQDMDNFEKSKTLINALAINGIVTQGLKWTFRTKSPNGDPDGWPSGHTSSSFCFATVMYHEYGPWVGVPLLGFAAFVGYERVDARNHDFSDVISGALIGLAIGHAIAENHQARLFGMDVSPFVDPKRGTVGIALSRSW